MRASSDATTGKRDAAASGGGDQDSKRQKLTAADPPPPIASVMASATVANGAAAASDQAVASTIDEDLYSRQLYVLGHEAQRRMASSSVLLVGVDGVGVEIAKNLILAGLKSVTLFDPMPAMTADLAAQFYLTPDHVAAGTPRAAASLPLLESLNPYVSVSLLEADGGASVADTVSAAASQYTAVVLVNQSLAAQTAVDAACRSADVKFMSVGAFGAFGRIFNDFGPAFTVSDVNGEQPRSVMISAVTVDGDDVVVTCLDEQRHDFEAGDHVSFTEVQGMTGLNDGKPREIKVLGPFTFSLVGCREEVAAMGEYVRGGYATQVKMPSTIVFKSLPEAAEEPEYVIADFAKMMQMGTTHAAFQAVDAFRATLGGALPTPGSAAHAAKFVEFVEAAAGSAADDLDAKVLECFARTAAGVLSPMAATLGGIAAQEVLKATSGKFMPIKQFFYIDCQEVLPSPPPTEAECAPTGSRYDGQVAVLGATVQKKLAALNYFLVGAGAIGCEMLKNWAMMGVGVDAASGGGIVITDMDQIEKSNLSRQFLFRDADIHKPKSVAAAAAVRVMNSDVNIVAHEVRVGPETEATFDDEFWDGLSGVCNALDNVQARLYVDQRCVYYVKPLLDSGTLGTKGNTQVVVPGLTESYSSSRDPPEKSIPICTLKNFPYQIEHTLQWARDWFEGSFRGTPEDCNAYLGSRGKDFFDDLKKQGPGTMLATLEAVHSSLVTERPLSVEDCIKWSRLLFEEMFSSSIKQLLHAFPADMVDANKVPFWSGTKRVPTPLTFNAADETHMAFVTSAALLRAQVYGIPVSDKDMAHFPAALAAVMVPDFVPKAGVKIATTEAEASEQNASGAGSLDQDDERIETLLKALPPAGSAGSDGASKTLVPLEFEKDDDTNHHIDVITACSNLRAANYSIEPADRHKSKMIAGKIIPAIATTTSFVTGLVCIEMLKLVRLGYTDRDGGGYDGGAWCKAAAKGSDAKARRDAAEKKLECFKNGFANLALPFFAFSEPVVAAATDMGHGRFWTLWDLLDVNEGRDITLGEFLEAIKTHYGLEVSMVSCGVSILYASFTNPRRLQERLATPLSEVARTVGKLTFLAKQRYLVMELICTDKEGEDVEVPYCRYRFRF